MNRQQAKELLPIIQAFAEGKIIQSRRINGMWIDLEMKTALNIIRLINEPQKYRIKPKPKYRPFKDADECWQEMQKHEPFGWIKGKEGEHHSLITSIIADEEEVYINGISGFVLDEIMEHYTFADGLPFGVKVEE